MTLPAISGQCRDTDLWGMCAVEEGCMIKLGWLTIACVMFVGCATAQSESVKSAPTVDVTGIWTGEWPGSSATFL